MLTKGECLVIAPIGAAGSDTRRRTETLFKFIVQRAVKDQYEALLPYRLDRPGKITMQVIEKIVTVPLLIADLTDNNANVFYELSLRHAINQPAILLIEENQLDSIPFDVQGLRTVPYNLTDPEKVENSVQELARQIASVERDPTHETNVISENLALVSEPKGPLDSKALLGSLLIANRFRFELIEPYFETLESLEVRNKRLQIAFQSVMRESAQKTWLRRQTILPLFNNSMLREQVAELFDEVETIIPALTRAMTEGDEEGIKAQLEQWRANNTAFLRAWAEQYSEWVAGLAS
jgi:hypothetical protein